LDPIFCLPGFIDLQSFEALAERPSFERMSRVNQFLAQRQQVENAN
jgi:hypothetical protein